MAADGSADKSPKCDVSNGTVWFWLIGTNYLLRKRFLTRPKTMFPPPRTPVVVVWGFPKSVS